MANTWFRMYSEFATDAKVQSMSEAMQRRLMMLFCLRCSNVIATLQCNELAFALRISEEELEETKELFLRKGFIDDAWNVLNWDKRQFISDSSTDRSRKHREAKRKEEGKNKDSATAVQRCSNSSATAPDTDTDTDKETTPKPPSGVELRFERFWSAYPKKVGKDAARRWWGKRKPDDAMLAAMLAAIAVQAKSAQWAKDGGQYIPHPTTWLNEGRWQDDAGGNAKAETSRPQWALDAGFPTVWEAENALCFERNAHEFRDGKRIGVAA